MANDTLAAALKEAMRSFPKSVAIVTTHWQGKDFAVPVSTADSLTLSPPAMLICINRTASIWPPLSQGATFAINLVGADQQDLIAHCAGCSGEERFARGDWERAGPAPPRLRSALASIACRGGNSMSFGTHDIFVGEVFDVRTAAQGDALAYLGGAYHRIARAS